MADLFDFIGPFIAERLNGMIDRGRSQGQPNESQVRHSAEFVGQILPDWLSDIDEALAAKDIASVLACFTADEVPGVKSILTKFIGWCKNNNHGPMIAKLRGYIQNLAEPWDRQMVWLLLINTIRDERLGNEEERFKLAISLIDSFSIQSDRWRLMWEHLRSKWSDDWKPAIEAHTATMKTDAWRQAKADVVINSISTPAAAALTRGLNDLFGDPNRENPLTVLFRRGVSRVRAKLHI